MTGPRVYTVEEAQELVPVFIEAFDKLDKLRSRLSDVKIKLTALEMIWGSKVNEKECPDHTEGVHHVEELKELEEQFNTVLADLAARGVTVKDIETGLVDVYHVRDGHLVNLCWQRGEDEIIAWHHVDAGFAGRQDL